jgi:hypothetical protein
VPIVGRSLRDAATQFVDHLNGVLFRTITQVPLQILPAGTTQYVNIGFRQAGGPQVASFDSDYGRLSLSLSQNCTSRISRDGKHELRTMEYWYYLYDADDETIMRWDYKREWPARENWEENQGKPEGDWVDPKYYPRHHVQGDLPLSLNQYSLTLDDVHTPCGYVAVEDIIRFCIEDLGARFRDRASDWHDVLCRSYARFCEDFTRGEDWDGDR